jgi:hypothetical protein
MVVFTKLQQPHTKLNLLRTTPIHQNVQTEHIMLSSIAVACADSVLKFLHFQLLGGKADPTAAESPVNLQNQRPD